MKKFNLFGATILGIALLTVSSGCHHHPTSITPIPENMQTPENPNGPGGGTPVTGENPVSGENTGGIPMMNGPWTHVLETGNQDPNKFKANTVYFDFDKATIKPSEEGKLQAVADYYKNNSTDALIVEGNCDERGTEKYNLSLGERRALAVREYLANLGMDPQRIKTVTYGASRPVDPGHNEAAWSKNRRGDLVLVTPK